VCHMLLLCCRPLMGWEDVQHMFSGMLVPHAGISMLVLSCAVLCCAAVLCCVVLCQLFQSSSASCWQHVA
jgi:hypothetical protein